MERYTQMYVCYFFVPGCVADTHIVCSCPEVLSGEPKTAEKQKYVTYRVHPGCNSRARDTFT
jgi:hypothetical protein